jgi:hypothetical protein
MQNEAGLAVHRLSTASRPTHSLIGINGSFTASHVCVEGVAHPHDWKAEARFLVPYRADARCYRAAFDALLAGWHGKQLPPELDWSEDIARALGTLCNCVWVHVWREDERIHAYWPPEGRA